MNPSFAIAQLAALIAVLAILHVPLGNYMARVFTSTKHTKAERGIYRLIGVDAAKEQSWQSYLRAVLAFSAVSVLVLYLLNRLQAILPLSLGLPAVPEGLAFNTAASFVTNTNWQSYSPETTLGYLVQMTGLAVQNFLSASVGITICVALIRGFSRKRANTLGNFWVDLTRGIWRLLLPLSLLSALILIVGGVIQNFDGFTQIQTITGATQSIPGGPVASQEAIKNIGTNGGGFYNANSAHPFENPSAWTSFFQNVLMLAIPFSLPRTFGKMIGDTRQGFAILSAMGVLYLASFTLLTTIENIGAGSAPQLAGAAMEGKEQRFGIFASALFGTTSTLTSTGAVNSMHDSYTALGGMLPMLNMMLGEVAPGGVGSGLYGMLMLAMLTVFIGGLLVGRTPEYLGKKIGPREIKLASLYILVAPTLVLSGIALSYVIPGIRENVTEVSVLNPGNHGLSEVIYAFTSAANNNGSAFAGLMANTAWFNTILGIVMLLGRFLPIVFVLALAGSLAKQDKLPATSGTLPTHKPLFIGLLVGITIVITALTFFPILTLGPLAEGLH